jgi:hypothetical protein
MIIIVAKETALSQQLTTVPLTTTKADEPSFCEKKRFIS